MTQEEKQLLIRDLCARLPYGVIIAYKEDENDYHCWILRTLNALGISKSDTAPDSDGEIEYTEQAGIGTRTSIRPLRLEKMLPYLRPLSSMTKEEKHELNSISHEFGFEWLDAKTTEERYIANAKMQSRSVDFYNAHHFDYRIDPSTGKTLIESGLAIEAPEGMYKIE